MKIIARFDKVTPTEIFNVSYDSNHIKHFEKNNKDNTEYDVYFNDDNECIGILPATTNSEMCEMYKKEFGNMSSKFVNSTNEQYKLEYAMGDLLNHLAYISCLKYSIKVYTKLANDLYKKTIVPATEQNNQDLLTILNGLDVITNDYKEQIALHYPKWAEYKSKLAKGLNTDDADQAKSSMKKALMFNSENISVNLETLSKCLLGTEKYLELKDYFEKQLKLSYLDRKNESLPF